MKSSDAIKSIRDKFQEAIKRKGLSQEDVNEFTKRIIEDYKAGK